MSRTNYTKFSNHDKREVTKVEKHEPVIETELEEIPVEEQDDFLTGVVDGCSMLNVRIEPSLDAEVRCVISVTTNVMIDPFESTDEFYRVYLADGSEGFCMKKFIRLE